jgi:DNA-binding NarL/FixJ family response regulator
VNEYEGEGMQTVNILIADDSRLVAERLRKLLTGIPGVGAVHNLHTLASVSAYLEIVTPDLLILDHHFPDGLGEDLLLRHGTTLSNTHIILYSAYGSLLSHSRYRALGARLIFDKSDSPDDLLHIVESVINIRVRRAEKTGANV